MREDIFYGEFREMRSLILGALILIAGTCLLQAQILTEDSIIIGEQLNTKENSGKNNLDFMPLPGDPGVEVAPLPENVPSKQNDDNQTSITDIVIDDSSGE